MVMSPSIVSSRQSIFHETYTEDITEEVSINKIIVQQPTRSSMILDHEAVTSLPEL